jgi:myosin-light-chain kinase
LCISKKGNRIKLIDFGFSRKYDPNNKLQVMFGSAEYSAPEVVTFDEIGFYTG